MFTAEEIRKLDDLRVYFEALLLDRSTPPELFTELFGVPQETVKEYKEKYYQEADLPRLVLFMRLKKIKHEAERDLKLKVFKFGWQWISGIVNSGRHIDGLVLGEKLVNTLMSKIAYLSHKDTIAPSEFKMLKDLLKMVHENSKIEETENDTDEIKIILKKLQEDASTDSRITDLVEDFNEQFDDKSGEKYNIIEQNQKGTQKVKESIKGKR